MRGLWDRIGISASLLCVLHCLLTPFLILLMPVLGEWTSHTTFHSLIVFIVVPVAVWALWNGYRAHRLKRVIVLGTLGLALLCVAMVVPNPQYETVFMIVAGLTLASAHLSNIRACQN